MARGVYKFFWDCGRQGDLDGTFSAEAEEVAAVIGKRIYFGEVLGKHSEIFGKVEKDDIKLVTEDPEAIALFDKYEFGSGFDPVAKFQEEEEERRLEEQYAVKRVADAKAE